MFVAAFVAVLRWAAPTEPSNPLWVLSLLYMVIPPIYFLLTRGQRLDSSPPEDRLKLIRSSLAQTSQLLAGLQDELDTRMRLLDQRQQDMDRVKHLASLNSEQARAIEDMVDRQLQRQDRKNVTLWWVGLPVAFGVGLVVNWISSPLWGWISSLG